MAWPAGPPPLRAKPWRGVARPARPAAVPTMGHRPPSQGLAAPSQCSCTTPSSVLSSEILGWEGVEKVHFCETHPQGDSTPRPSGGWLWLRGFFKKWVSGFAGKLPHGPQVLNSLWKCPSYVNACAGEDLTHSHPTFFFFLPAAFSFPCKPLPIDNRRSKN